MNPEIIEKELLGGSNIVLVGPTNSGKSWFLQQQLIPWLKKKNIKASYLKDCNESMSEDDESDYFIIDEVETFFDKGFLETRHPDKTPYYTDEYLSQVNIWHKNIAQISKPAVFVITRNEDEEIDYLVKNLKQTDWGKPVKVLKFIK